ncbi:hypothetical protein KSP39_PZI006711 [Platanthera zijinensis]|uniref:Target of Myb protein 1 n=1 Tax=Platanthera zijinensis TaxID=2320716 RepID=A0AAP0G9Z9_9ASPA
MSSSAIVRVEKATSDLLLGPDWTMNLEICDSINLDPGLAKDVVRAVKKRLQHKSSRVQFFALTLLETMFKNCGDSVHSLVVEKDILSEMVKIVRKKSDMIVRDKILALLDSCQEAFGGPGGKYPQYFWAYIDLKRSGVEFPRPSGDASLIYTPHALHTATPNLPQSGYGMPNNLPMSLDQAMASEMTNLSLSDLERIGQVAELLNDMLKAVNIHDCKAVEDEVIADLVDQCRSNQKNILQLIDSTGDEVLLGEGLVLNDNLQSVLAKHDAIISGSPIPRETSVSAQEPTTLSPATAVTKMFEEDGEEEEDDEFSQLARRNRKTKPSANTSATDPLALPDPPRPVKTTAGEQTTVDPLSITLSLNATPLRASTTPTRTPYSNHVAPWAQPQSPVRFHFRPEPPPPRSRPQYPLQQQLQPELPRAQTTLPPEYESYPPPPWEDAPSPTPSTPYAYRFPALSSNPFGMDSANPPVVTGAGSPKSFVPSYRIFEDRKNPASF